VKPEYTLLEKLSAFGCALSVLLIPVGVLLLFLFAMMGIGVLSAFAIGYSWHWIVTNNTLIFDIMLLVVTPIAGFGWILWIVIVDEYRKILRDRSRSCQP